MSALTRREGLVRGTLAITFTILFVRVMAFLYRPIVIRMFAPFDGDDGWTGLGMAQAPATAYLIALSFTSLGFNVAIAKLVSERLAFGDKLGARQVFRTSLWLMLGLGVLAGVGFLLGAPLLASTARMAGTSLGYMAMAPALLVMSVVAAYRGLLQGFRFLQANAYSQFIEAVIRILAGLFLIRLWAPKSVSLGAAGYNLGDLAGALASLFYLGLLYSRNRHRLWGDLARPVEGPAPAAAGTSRRETLMAILRIGLPVALLGAAPPLMMYSDTFILGHALPGATSDQISAIYGQLTSGLAVVWVPAVFTGALYTAVVPAMAEALAHQQRETAHRYAALALRATMLIAWPAAVGLAVLAFPIYRLCFSSAAGANLMMVLAIATIPVMVQQTAAGILQGMGHVGPPVLSLCVGTALKVLLTLMLVPRLGAAGAAWATVLGFFSSALLNLVQLRRRLGIRLQWVDTVVKPVAASLVMGALVGGAWRLISSTLVRPWVQTLATVALVVLGALLYAGLLLLMKGLAGTDVERLPYFGRPLADFLMRRRTPTPPAPSATRTNK